MYVKHLAKELDILLVYCFTRLGFHGSGLYNNMLHLAILKVFMLIVKRYSFLVKPDWRSLNTEFIPNSLKLYTYYPSRNSFCFSAVYQMSF